VRVYEPPPTLDRACPAGQWVKENPKIVAAAAGAGVVGAAGVAAAAAVIGAALAPVLVPLILGGTGGGLVAGGLAAGGIVASSLIAGVHASVGSVAGGSLFALAHSVGASAVPLVGLASAKLGLFAALLGGKVVGLAAQTEMAVVALAQSVSATGVAAIVRYLASAGLNLSTTLLQEIVGWVALQLMKGALREHVKLIADLPRMREEQPQSE
jgi:hypothetical protein